MAVERGLEVVGEAARRTPAEARARRAHILWDAITGQRNVLAHEYGEIQQKLIWKTAVEDMPTLTRQLLEIIPDTPDPGALPWSQE